MRILIAAKHPPGGSLAIGGVQTWSATVGLELARLGHTVVYWGPEWELPSGHFDAGVFANWKHTHRAAKNCKNILKISHGIIDDEQGGKGFAATSEEVGQRWGSALCVIRQPIDLDYWTPADYPRKYLTRFSYRRGLPYLQDIAQSLGLHYQHIRDLSPHAVRDALRRSAVVVATGRAALESMACGAPVVIADDREYQGPLMHAGDIIECMKRNYSGRGGIVPDPKSMIDAITAAMADGSMRDHVIEHHDVKKITRQILCLLF